MNVIVLEATPARLRELVTVRDLRQLRETLSRQAAAALGERAALVLTPIVPSWHAAFIMEAYG